MLWIIDALSALCILSSALIACSLSRPLVQDTLDGWRARRRGGIAPVVEAFSYCRRRAPFVPLLIGFCDELTVKRVVFSREGDTVEVNLHLYWWGLIAWWNRPRLKTKVRELLEVGGVREVSSESSIR